MKNENNQKKIDPQLYHTLIDNSNDGIAIINPETGRFRDVNRVMCERLGYSRKELLSMKVSDVEAVIPNGYSWKKHVEEVREKKGVFVNGEHKRKNDTVFPVEVNVREIHTEKGDYMVAIARDITEHRIAEKELKIKEKALATAINAIAFSDLVGKLTYVNGSFLKMWGYDDKAEILGRSVLDFWAEEEKVLEVTRSVDAKGKWQGELTARKKDGSVFYVELSATLVTDDKGEPVCRMASFMDITRQKKTDKKLREKEEEQRLIVESANLGIGTVYRDGMFRSVNESYCEMLGYSSDELLSRSVSNITHPDDREENVRALKNIFTTKKRKITFETRYLHKDGTEVDVIQHGSIVHSPKGAPQFAVWITEDITERKQAEKEIERQKKLLSNVIANIPHFVFWKDRKSVYFGCSENFAKVAGVDRQENIVGKTDYDLPWRKKQSDFYRKCDKEIMESGIPMLDIEESLLQSDGKEVVVLTSKVPLKDDAGEVYGILGIYTDITERKQIEDVLRGSEERYRVIFENTGSAMVIVEGDLTIHIVNAEFEKLIGYSKKEVEGRKKITDFITKNYVDKIKEYHRLRLIDPEAAPRNYEVQVVNKHGRISNIYLTVAIIPGTDKSVTSLLDITEMKETEFELIKRKELLDNTNKALEHKLKELQAAAGHIKNLEGLVPICAGCKKMLMEEEDPKDATAWVPLEKYISERTDASFTHGLCPDCMKKAYGKIRKRKS